MTGVALKKNSFFSLLTSAVPVLVGLVTVPILIRLLGLERFAFLSIIWALIGYFGILDLGLSRSLGKRAAKRHAAGDRQALSADIGFGICLVFGAGLLVALGVHVYGPALINERLQAGGEFLGEAVGSLSPIAFSVPVLMLLAAIKGIFEGIQQFRQANFIQLFSGIANFILPAIVAFWAPDIRPILWVLLGFRIVLLIISLYILHRKVSFRLSLVGDWHLLTEGGWLTLSAIASPLMVYVDRLVLGTMVTLKSLAFYTTPVDLIGRLWIVPQAITRVTFPAFAYLAKEPAKTRHTFEESLELMTFICFVPMLGLFFFSHEILHWWISLEMADSAALILRILCVGIFWNCLEWVSYSLLQATDGVRVAGIVALFEVPFYFLALWAVSANHGILGAAFVWAGRLLFDVVLIDGYFILRKGELLPVVLKKNRTSLLFTGLCLAVYFAEKVGDSGRFLAGLVLVIGSSFYYYKSSLTKEILIRLKKMRGL